MSWPVLIPTVADSYLASAGISLPGVFAPPSGVGASSLPGVIVPAPAPPKSPPEVVSVPETVPPAAPSTGVTCTGLTSSGPGPHPKMTPPKIIAGMTAFKIRSITIIMVARSNLDQGALVPKRFREFISYSPAPGTLPAQG